MTAVAVPAPQPGDADYADHVQLALDRLAEQFKVEGSNIEKLLTAFGSAGFQPIENCLKQLLLQRTLDNAIGVQLDVIGKKVGQARGGLSDDDYRRYCRATIRANNSNGTGEDISAVANLIIFTPGAVYRVKQSSPATVTVEVLGVGISDALAQTAFAFLKRTASVGIRVILKYSNIYPAFRLDVDHLDVGRLAAELST